MILAAFVAAVMGKLRVIVPLYRSTLVRTFVTAAGRDDARRALAAVADYRSGDRNIRPGELARVEALVAREALGG